jgi:hypothetical protein
MDDRFYTQHIQPQIEAIVTAVDSIQAELDLTIASKNTLQARLDVLLDLLEHTSFGVPALAMHASNKDNVLTTGVMSYLINGRPYRLAAQTEIVTPAATQQAADQSAWYLVEIDDAAAVSFVKGADAATAAAAVLPARTAATALIGVFRVDLASGATFTLGTTLFDAANVTATFFDARFISTLAALGALDGTAVGAITAFDAETFKRIQ